MQTGASADDRRIGRSAGARLGRRWVGAVMLLASHLLRAAEAEFTFVTVRHAKGAGPQAVGCTPAGFTAPGVDRELRLVPASPLDGCTAPRMSGANSAAHGEAFGLLIMRGGCDFAAKALAAEEAGAAAVLVINDRQGASPRMEASKTGAFGPISIAICMADQSWAWLSKATAGEYLINFAAVTRYVSGYDGLAAKMTQVQVRAVGVAWFLPAGHAAWNIQTADVAAPVVRVRFQSACYDDSACAQCYRTPFTRATMALIAGSAALIQNAPSNCITYMYELAFLVQIAGARYACPSIV
jgi:hypothetical protein